MFWKTLGTCALAIGFSASAASAGKILIGDDVQSGFFISSGDLSGTVFGANATGPELTQDALKFIHDDINGNSVSTNEFVTIAAIDTSDGLGLFALLDDQTNSETGSTVYSLEMKSTVDPGTSSWYNDEDTTYQDNVGVSSDFNEGTTLHADNDGDFSVDRAQFRWDINKGDAFAWADLEVGSNGDFKFYADEDNTDDVPFDKNIQFVSYGVDGWEKIANEHINIESDGTVATFAYEVVPSSAALAALPILGGILLRRRLRA